MTVYDKPPASDGKGGPHPLAGVPQEVLDAATKELEGSVEGMILDLDEIEAVAHAVVSAALTASPGWRVTDGSERLVIENAVRMGAKAALDPGAFVRRRKVDGEYERLDQWIENAICNILSGLRPKQVDDGQ